MKHRCAWCGASIGVAEISDSGEVSHGICSACAEEMLAQLDVTGPAERLHECSLGVCAGVKL